MPSSPALPGHRDLPARQADPPTFLAEVFVRDLLTGALVEHDLVPTSPLGTIYDATHYYCRARPISVQARDDHTGRWSNLVILRVCPV